MKLLTFLTEPWFYIEITDTLIRSLFPFASFFFHNLLAMEGKLFVGQYLILVISLLGQLHGYISCIEKEMVALLDLKKYTIASNESNQFLTDWTNLTKSDCCQWEKVKCDRASGRVIRLSIGWAHHRESSLNLSLLHPFEEIQILDLSWSGFSGLFDDVEGIP